MVIWKINYWDAHKKEASSIEAALDELTDEQFKSLAKEIKLLEICGNALKLPHSKSLGKKLFELRERRFGYRIYYTFFGDKTITMLHIGDKSSQRNDIRISKDRLTKLLKGDD